MNWLTIAGVSIIGFAVGFALGASLSPVLVTAGLATGIGLIAGGIVGAWPYLTGADHGRDFGRSNLA